MWFGVWVCRRPKRVRPHVPVTRGRVCHTVPSARTSLVQGLGMLSHVITACMFVFAVSIRYFRYEGYEVTAACRRVMLVSVAGCVRSSVELFNHSCSETEERH